MRCDPGFADLRVDAAVAGDVASAYLGARLDRSPLVRAAWARLVVESDRLFSTLTSPDRPGHVRVVFTSCLEPYSTVEELIESVRRDRRLEVTAAAVDRDRRHPMMDGAVGGAFDRFRAVHDVLGHAVLKVGFDRHEEYAAWRFQERFHSDLARRALATELHAKHSVRWTTGEAPDHRAVVLDPRLLRRSRDLGTRAPGPGTSRDA